MQKSSRMFKRVEICFIINHKSKLIESVKKDASSKASADE